MMTIIYSHIMWRPLKLWGLNNLLRVRKLSLSPLIQTSASKWPSAPLCAWFLGIVATFISSPQPELSPFLPSSPDSLYVLSSPSSSSPHHFTQFQDLYPGLSQQHSPLSNPSSVNTRRIEIAHCPMDEGML